MTKKSDLPKHFASANARYGALYGAVTGAIFACCLWGYDFIFLAGAHVYLPFLKLVLGILLFALVFAVAGWITAAVGRAWMGLIWIPAAWGVAYLMVFIPFKLTPLAYGIFDPGLQGWLDYPFYDEFNARFMTAFFVLSFFAAFLGLIENLLVEQATHAAAFASKLTPFLVCLAAMLVAGLIMDELINQQLRGAVNAVDTTLDFAVAHQGEEIDKMTIRRMRLGALNTIKDLIDRDRRLVIRSYDSTLGEVEVLVDFDGEWANCWVFYEQLSNCKPAEAP